MIGRMSKDSKVQKAEYKYAELLPKKVEIWYSLCFRSFVSFLAKTIFAFLNFWSNVIILVRWPCSIAFRLKPLNVLQLKLIVSDNFSKLTTDSNFYEDKHKKQHKKPSKKILDFTMQKF